MVPNSSLCFITDYTTAVEFSPSAIPTSHCSSLLRNTSGCRSSVARRVSLLPQAVAHSVLRAGCCNYDVVDMELTAAHCYLRDLVSDGTCCPRCYCSIVDQLQGCVHCRAALPHAAAPAEATHLVNRQEADFRNTY